MNRVVVDASVLVSAAAAHPNSPSSRVLQALNNEELTLVACERLLDEFVRALSSPYFERRLSPGQRGQMEQLVREFAVLLPDLVDPPAVLRDRQDDYLIALADAGQAVAIITGDNDLLESGTGLPPWRPAARRHRMRGSPAD